jgi:hypothetical protein
MRREIESVHLIARPHHVLRCRYNVLVDLMGFDWQGIQETFSHHSCTHRCRSSTTPQHTIRRRMRLATRVLEVTAGQGSILCRYRHARILGGSRNGLQRQSRSHEFMFTHLRITPSSF